MSRPSKTWLCCLPIVLLVPFVLPCGPSAKSPAHPGNAEATAVSRVEPEQVAEFIKPLLIAREAKAHIEDALQTTTAVEFIDTPLADALNKLAEAGKFAVWIDKPALGKERIAPDEPVSATLEEVTIQQVLYVILPPLERDLS